MPGKTPIPLCRSRFLQDLTIALGRRSLKSLRQSHTTLTFEVKEEVVEGFDYERLDIEANNRLNRLTRITAWEDAEFWVYSRTRVGKRFQPPTEIRANLIGTNSEYIAELIRATLRDFDSAQATWRQHTAVRNPEPPTAPR